MNRLRVWAALGLAVATLAGLAGCGVEGLHNANPQTTIKAGAFQFSNNKDSTVELEDGTYDPTTKAVHVKNLKIDDNASNPRRANVEQIDALGRESYAIGQAWSMGLTAGAQLAAQIVPGMASFAPRPPWGAGQPGIAPPTYQYFTPATGQPSTSQPAAGPATCTSCGLSGQAIADALNMLSERLAAIEAKSAQPATK